MKSRSDLKKRGSWAKLLTHKESRGDMQGAALVKKASPVAWQQVNLYERYEFRKQPEPVDVDEIARELPEIRIEPRPLWRRDPELNLFCGDMQKPPNALLVRFW
jgi:hypothetical protein